MSDENLIKTKDGLAYEKWKEKGRIRLSTVLVVGFLGIFTSGWLLWYIYFRAGKPGLYVLLPLVACTALARQNLIFLLVELVVYVLAWTYIYYVVKKYHSVYKQEPEATVVAK